MARKVFFPRLSQYPSESYFRKTKAKEIITGRSATKIRAEWVIFYQGEADGEYDGRRLGDDKGHVRYVSGGEAEGRIGKQRSPNCSVINMYALYFFYKVKIYLKFIWTWIAEGNICILLLLLTLSFGRICLWCIAVSTYSAEEDGATCLSQWREMYYKSCVSLFDLNGCYKFWPLKSPRDH